MLGFFWGLSSEFPRAAAPPEGHMRCWDNPHSLDMPSLPWAGTYGCLWALCPCHHQLLWGVFADPLQGHPCPSFQQQRSPLSGTAFSLQEL